MSGKLVTIARFVYANEAEAARAALEAAGVPACLQSAELVAMAWHLSNAVGEVKLQVVEDDVQVAREILTGVEFLSPDSEGAAPVAGMHRCAECGISFAPDTEVCPACGTPATAARTTSEDEHLDPEFHGGGGMLMSIRRSFLWLIWVWVPIGVLYLGLGLMAMLAGILHDITRGALGGPQVYVSLLATVMLLAAIGALVASRRRRDNPS